MDLLGNDASLASAALQLRVLGYKGSSVSPDLDNVLAAQGSRVLRRCAFMRVHLQHPASKRNWDSSALDRYQVRQVFDNDAVRLAQLEQAAFPADHVDHKSCHLAELVQVSNARLHDFERPLMSESSLAFDRDRPVASVLVQSVRRVNEMEGPWVTSLARDPDVEYIGVGAALLTSVLRQLGRQGHRMVYVSVTEGNPARSIYERLGFTEFVPPTSLELVPQL